MFQLKSRSLGPVWIEYLQVVLDNGEWAHDDREQILETAPITFTIDHFEDAEGILKTHGNEHIIETYTSKMFSLEIIEELNSTYGDRFFSNLGVDQIAWAVDRLRANPWAKSCFLPLVLPNDPGPRIPCLSAVQIALRKDAVQFFATLRSQNVFNAYGNFVGIRKLQSLVASTLDARLGSIYFFC